jgi:hypothetical protein
MKPLNDYLWVEPIQEQGAFKVDEVRGELVKVLSGQWLDKQLIIKHLEVFTIEEKQYYFVKEENVVAIYE